MHVGKTLETDIKISIFFSQSYQNAFQDRAETCQE